MFFFYILKTSEITPLIGMYFKEIIRGAHKAFNSWMFKTAFFYVLKMKTIKKFNNERNIIYLMSLQNNRIQCKC